MKRTLLIFLLMNLFISSFANVSDTSKKYYPFKSFGYNYKGGIYKENNKWKIIDSVKNISSDTYDGIFPLFSIQDNDTVLVKSIICKNCTIQLESSLSILKPNAKHIQIKPDPEDESTWYDSLELSGEKVYDESQYLKQFKIRFSGRKQESALLNLNTNQSLSSYFYSINFLSRSIISEKYIHVNDLKEFQSVPIIDVEDAFVAFDTIGSNSFYLLTRNNEKIVINNIHGNSNSYGVSFFSSNISKKNFHVNRKGDRLKTDFNWSYEILCNGHIITDTNKNIRGKCISSYSVSEWIKPDATDRNTWFDSIVEYNGDKISNYYCYLYFPTKGNLGVFDVNENKWKVEPSCDTLIIEYNSNTIQNPSSYFFPVSFDHKASFINFDPKQFCNIISYYYHSKNIWYRYMVEENKNIKIETTPFEKIDNPTDPITLKN